MINNSTNINKTSVHFSSQITEHNKYTTYAVGNRILGRTQQCGGDKPAYRISTLHLMIIWSPMAIHIYKINKTAKIRFHSKRPQTIKNEWKHAHGQNNNSQCMLFLVNWLLRSRICLFKTITLRTNNQLLLQ